MEEEYGEEEKEEEEWSPYGNLFLFVAKKKSEIYVANSEAQLNIFLK